MHRLVRFVCFSAVASSAMAGVIRSSELDDVERRIRSGANAPTRLLNPSGFNVAPKFSPATAAVIDGAGNVPNGAPVAAWGRIVSAADAARAQQAAASVQYAPGIRSMVVSWASLYESGNSAAPDSGGSDSGSNSSGNGGTAGSSTGGGSNQQPTTNNSGAPNQNPRPTPSTPPPSSSDNPPSDDVIPTDPVGDGNSVPSDNDPIPPVGGGNDGDPIPPLPNGTPPGGAIPSPDAGLLTLAGIGVLSMVRRRV